MKSNEKQITGRRGEYEAERWLEKLGYRIISRNWRCRNGEIDLIAEVDDMLIIVEVRSRSSKRLGTALESINMRKQQKLRSLAQIYQHMTGKHEQTIRFDVIAIQWQSDGTVGEIEHVVNAF